LYCPSDWLVKKSHFHEKPVCLCMPIIVALPIRAYIGVYFAAIEGYGRFCRGLVLLVGAKSGKSTDYLNPE